MKTAVDITTKDLRDLAYFLQAIGGRVEDWPEIRELADDYGNGYNNPLMEPFYEAANKKATAIERSRTLSRWTLS